MQNIGADNQGDAFYRYKMPKLVAKVEGRGNGIKTNVVNNVDIARALDRPPTYTLKHFGCELGAQTNFNAETGTSIVNGAHTADKLSETLELFIKKYVQCYGCGNPETVVKVRKGLIHLKCKACGHTSDVDMRDKLTTFIVKNPPENKLSKSEKKVKDAEKERMRAAEKEARKAEKAALKEKKQRKGSKRDSDKGKDGGDGSGSGDDGAAGGSNDGSGNGNDSDGDDDDDDGTQWKTDMSAEAVARRQQEQLTAAAAALVQRGDAEEATNGAAPAPALSVEPSASDALPAQSSADGAARDSENLDDESAEPEERVRAYLKAYRPARGLPEFLEALPLEGAAGPLVVVERMKVFYGALLRGDAGKVADALAERDKYVLALKQDATAQAAQLVALEHFVTTVEPERIGEMPFVLKMLYEEDLIDEQVIIEWGEAGRVARKAGVDKAQAARVRELSAKVLAWLQEDSSDEEV